LNFFGPLKRMKETVSQPHIATQPLIEMPPLVATSSIQSQDFPNFGDVVSSFQNQMDQTLSIFRQNLDGYSRKRKIEIDQNLKQELQVELNEYKKQKMEELEIEKTQNWNQFAEAAEFYGSRRLKSIDFEIKEETRKLELEKTKIANERDDLLLSKQTLAKEFEELQKSVLALKEAHSSLSVECNTLQEKKEAIEETLQKKNEDTKHLLEEERSKLKEALCRCMNLISGELVVS
jgi:hypothetical protein